MTATIADSGQRRPFPKHVSGELRPFPLEPLVAWLLPDGAGWARPDDYTVGVISTVALRLEVDRNWVHRNLDAGGLGVYVADAVAIRLRVHPVSIWPDWFEHAPAEEQVLAKEASERQRATRREAHLRHEGTGPLGAVDGARLRRCRKEAGYKVAPFAEELGISAAYLYKIERGCRMAKSRADLVRRASDILGVDQGTLIVGGSTDADRAAAWAVHDELRTPLSELFLQWCQQEAPKAS